MDEARKIKFKVKVFSKIGSLVDEFTVEAETKKDAKYIVDQQLKSEGIHKEVNYKIT